jgi:S1-C subfamily serine protease
MDHDVQRLLRYLSDSESTQSSGGPSWFGENPEAEILDACSRAIARIVERIGPSVIAVLGDEASPSGAHVCGSGVVISPDGFALTSSQVVRGRNALRVVGHEGERLDAIVIGDDPATDLALLKVSSGNLLHTLIGRSGSLRVGHTVVCIGNPYGLQAAASSGIISSPSCGGCFSEGPSPQDLMQHTALLQPGCMGGPIVDASGHIVGISIASGPALQGFSFAVRSETAAWVASEFLRHGRVRRLDVGLSVGPISLSRITVRSLDLLSPSAVQVAMVVEQGPAAIAGVMPGDVITSVCGRVIDSVEQWHRVLSRASSNAVIQLTVLRAGKVLELDIPIRTTGDAAL